MIRSIRLYLEYRRQGLRRAWHYAGLGPVAWSVATYVAVASFAVGVAVLASRQAQAIAEAADNRVAARVSAQAGEIDALRRIVAACLSDSTGRPVKIGREWFLCGIVPTGVRE